MNESNQHIFTLSEALAAGEVVAWLNRVFAILGILGAPFEIDRHALIALLLSWLVCEWLYERLQSTEHELWQSASMQLASGPGGYSRTALELQVSRTLHLLQWQALAAGITLSCLIVFGFNNQ